MFTLHQVVPIPIKDQIQSSDIWATSCTLKADQRYFIAAPSGKGKTTFQHFLYGLRQDYIGKIKIGEQSIKNFKADDWATIRQNKLSIIFQDLRLFLDLTALENIQLKNKLTNHQTDAAIQTMATQLGIDSLLDKKCGQMSYGQRQRVAIIRALCQPFDFLIMDEPFSHLDSSNIAKCCTLIMEECTKNKAGYAIASLEEKYNLIYDHELQL
jgi:ABC-type lipoprotein export system ATPase subunit